MPKHFSIKPKNNSRKKRTVKRKKSNKKGIFTHKWWLLFAIIMLGGFAWMGYYIGKETQRPSPALNQSKAMYSTEALLKDLKKTKKTKKTNTPKVKQDKVARTQKKADPRNRIVRSAKLVIIIDDVHTRSQLNAIDALGMKVTPSIFPPYSLAKKSHLLAKGRKHCMVHLPMESGSKQFNKQYKTLKTSFSKAEIIARVKEIRKLFPHVKYLNNHTGSVFTSDYKAMRQLYVALYREGFVFVDSMTIASSKVKQIADEFGDKYRKRNIFIDNDHSVASIHKQLKLAVAKAKKNGYAIAIGHPHKITIKALATAKSILDEVELVYIDALY